MNNGKENTNINSSLSTNVVNSSPYNPSSYNITQNSLHLNLNNTKQPTLNPLKNRLLILSPTVQEGLERESNKDDFEALDDKALGKGGFGHVWKVRHKVTGKIYAIKVISKDYIRKENMIEQMNREIEIMYRTDHPHIIKLYNHYEDEDNFYLIMHCASKGQLYSQLKRLKRLDERTVAQYMREVISAVKYLHSMKPPIIHRDIKPENILLDADGRAKLADFGWSNFYEENKQRETYCGTPEYLAPEMVTKSGHNEAIDTWSLGVLMFELLAGRPPFVYKGDTTALYNDIKALKIRWTDDFPIMAKNIITKILKIKPTERPSLDEILEHPWFRDTPIIRPILSLIDYDPAAKLRSHLIHVLPEDEEKVVSEIKSMLSQRRESIRKGEVDTSMDLNNILNISGISAITTQRTGKSDKEVVLETELKFKKEEVVLLKEDNFKKDKIIEELKSKLEKITNEDATLRIKDQERGSIMTELELKTKNLLEVESQLNMIKNEYSQLDRQYRQIKENYDEMQIKFIQMEKNSNELNFKLNKLDQEKQTEIMNLETKLRIAEVNYVQSQVDSGQNNRNSKEGGYDPDKILQMTKEYLAELVDIVQKTFIKLEERILNQERKEADFRENYIKSIDKRITEMVNNFKETHERILLEEKKIFQKQLDDAENKHVNNAKSIDWYRNQIKELQPFKQKVANESAQLSKFQNDINTLNHTKLVLEEKNLYMESYLKTQNEAMINIRNAKERYRNAFLEAEKLYYKSVKDKKDLRALINFKENFPEC